MRDKLRKLGADGRTASGTRLSKDHETAVLEWVARYHKQCMEISEPYAAEVHPDEENDGGGFAALAPEDQILLQDFASGVLKENKIASTSDGCDAEFARAIRSSILGEDNVNMNRFKRRTRQLCPHT